MPQLTVGPWARKCPKGALVQELQRERQAADKKAKIKAKAKEKQASLEAKAKDKKRQKLQNAASQEQRGDDGAGRDFQSVIVLEPDVEVNSHVSVHVTRIGGNVHVGGRVRYIGGIEGKEGTWVGVELDDPKFGKNSGEVDGRRYFECATNHGLFIRSEQVEALPDAVSAVPVVSAVPAQAKKQAKEPDLLAELLAQDERKRVERQAMKQRVGAEMEKTFDCGVRPNPVLSAVHQPEKEDEVEAEVEVEVEVEAEVEAEADAEAEAESESQGSRQSQS